MSEIKIICDTNIWYHVGNNRLKIPENSHLIATWLNVTELLYSHPQNKANFSKNEQLKAIEAILNKSHDIIELDMTQYAFDLLFPEHNINFTNVNLKNILENILYGRVSIDKDLYDKGFVFFDGYKKFKKHFADTIKYYCTEIRNAKSEYKEMKDIEMYKRFCEFITDINDNIRPIYDINITNEGDTIEQIKEDFENVKNRFYLYLNAKQLYLEDIAFDKTFDKMNWVKKENDFGDLYNLIYASDNIYYWTQDKKWYNRCVKTNYKNIIPFQNF